MKHEPKYKFEPLRYWIVYHPSWQAGGVGPQIAKHRGTPWHVSWPFAGPFKTHIEAQRYLDADGKAMVNPLEAYQQLGLLRQER